MARNNPHGEDEEIVYVIKGISAESINGGRDKMKTCAKCKEQKELTEFRKHIRNPDGYQYYCKVCQDAMNKASRKKKR